ncbi:Hypothetical predicted protein [Cloeon dipterum]|uniref:Autophagy-related protein n=1 Tax=Cloeon dipterum TaxID=197152 RepID=A0A8S1BZA4_9INSE|nr:Hypothetical predicted protein [Cloeon dipterum]
MSPQNTRADEGVGQPHQDKDSPCDQAINGKTLLGSNSDSFYLRLDEVAEYKSKFPRKVPIYLKKSEREKSLKSVEVSKYLVPDIASVSQFIMILRRRMKLSPYESLYLMVNNQRMSEDGYLHITYASQETFG